MRRSAAVLCALVMVLSGLRGMDLMPEGRPVPVSMDVSKTTASDGEEALLRRLSELEKHLVGRTIVRMRFGNEDIRLLESLHERGREGVVVLPPEIGSRLGELVVACWRARALHYHGKESPFLWHHVPARASAADRFECRVEYRDGKPVFVPQQGIFGRAAIRASGETGR